MDANDQPVKSFFAHVTGIIFRPKAETQTVALTPEQAAKKAAEAEEKRKKMLEAYSRHCNDVKT